MGSALRDLVYTWFWSIGSQVDDSNPVECILGPVYTWSLHAFPLIINAIDHEKTRYKCPSECFQNLITQTTGGGLGLIPGETGEV